MFARYKPFKDLIHYEEWSPNGTLFADRTNSNNLWTFFYYARKHQNILPSVSQLAQRKVLNNEIITNHITDNISYSQWIMFGRYSPSRELIHYDIWNYNSSHYGDITNSNAWWFYFYYARRDFKNIPSDENMYDLKRMYGSGTNKLWALTDQGHIYGAGYIDKDYTR